jgi:hypothetical protein
MTENRKAWVEPELIVLVRNKPEEGVLSSCKGPSSAAGVTGDQDGCKIEFCGPGCAIPWGVS